MRRAEVTENEVLKKTRYLWLKNTANLTDKQKVTIENISKLNLKTSRAYQIRLTFQEFFTSSDRVSGEAFLNKWYCWATHSQLELMIKAAKTIKKHWDEVINWFDSHLTTLGFQSPVRHIEYRRPVGDTHGRLKPNVRSLCQRHIPD